MMALAGQGLAEGVWLRAQRQTTGRGRQGRVWLSPAGNLYASTLVRLRRGDPPAATLALVAAVALHGAASELDRGAALSIKWPNDLLAEGAKLGGILLERIGDAIIVGFGVNLAFHPEDLDRPVTCFAKLGVDVGPDQFCVRLASCFASWLGRWRTDGLDPIAEAWGVAAHPVGTQLLVRTGDGGALEGLFGGLDEDGALSLRLADGSVRAIHAGDVFLV